MLIGCQECQLNLPLSIQFILQQSSSQSEVAPPTAADAWNPHPAGSDPWATRPSDPWNTGSTDGAGNYIPASGANWNSGRDSLSDALGR